MCARVRVLESKMCVCVRKRERVCVCVCAVRGKGRVCVCLCCERGGVERESEAMSKRTVLSDIINQGI